jgi:multiple sugar transport system permease protein
MGKYSKTFWKIFFTIIIGLIALTMVLPLLWMISTSFKIEGEVFEFPIRFIPKTWDFNNYSETWNGSFNFPLYYWNSIKISVMSTIVQVAVSAMAAYAFSKIKFKFCNLIFIIYLSTMMLPSQVTLIPCFMIFKKLGLIDTHAGLIILTAFSVYGVFLLKQFMGTIPSALSEAAIIDGANHFQIFSRIMVPMTKPAIVTLAMLKFIWTWNDYQHPLIFLNTVNKFTIQLGMRTFSTENGNLYGPTMAAAVLSILPLMIVFLICQKNVIEGIAIGAVKG